MRAAVSSGRSLTLISLFSKLDKPSAAGGVMVSIEARPALGGRGEGGGAHGGDDLLVAGLDRLERVSGIDRAHEGVRRLHLDNVGDLRHVEQSRHARSDVLAHGGGRREQHVVILHQRHDQIGRLFGKALFELRRIGEQHLAHAGKLGRFFGNAPGILAGDKDIDLAAELRSSVEHLGGRRGQSLVVVLGEKQDRHLRELPPRSSISR